MILPNIIDFNDYNLKYTFCIFHDYIYPYWNYEKQNIYQEEMKKKKRNYCQKNLCSMDAEEWSIWVYESII